MRVEHLEKVGDGLIYRKRKGSGNHHQRVRGKLGWSTRMWWVVHRIVVLSLEDMSGMIT